MTDFGPPITHLTLGIGQATCSHSLAVAGFNYLKGALEDLQRNEGQPAGMSAASGLFVAVHGMVDGAMLFSVTDADGHGLHSALCWAQEPPASALAWVKEISKAAGIAAPPQPPRGEPWMVSGLHPIVPAPKVPLTDAQRALHPLMMDRTPDRMEAFLKAVRFQAWAMLAHVRGLI